MFGLDAFGTGMFFIGAVGTVTYVIKLLLMLIFGLADSDLMDMDIDHVDFTSDIDTGDVSADIDLDLDVDESQSSFNWLSINIVTSFMMLFGWFTLGTYQFIFFPPEKSLMFNLISQGIAMVVGGLAGIAGIKINTWMIKQLARVQQSGTMNKKSLIGQEGTVYITVAPSTLGAIMVKADNQVIMEMAAITRGKEVIRQGQKVKVVDIENSKLVIEPINEGV